MRASMAQSCSAFLADVQVREKSPPKAQRYNYSTSRTPSTLYAFEYSGAVKNQFFRSEILRLEILRATLLDDAPLTTDS